MVAESIRALAEQHANDPAILRHTIAKLVLSLDAATDLLDMPDQPESVRAAARLMKSDARFAERLLNGSDREVAAALANSAKLFVAASEACAKGFEP